MEARDIEGSFENYIESMVRLHCGMKYDDQHIFTAMEALMNPDIGVSVRFFDYEKSIKKGGWSFIQEQMEHRPIEGSKIEAAFSSIPKSDTNFVTLQAALQSVRETNELPTKDFLLDDLDKDLTEREDWKAFWAKLKKEVGDMV